MNMDLDTIANLLDTVAKMAAGLGLTQPWMIAVAAAIGLAAGALHIAANLKNKQVSAADVAAAATSLAPQVDATKTAVEAALKASQAAPAALPAFGAATDAEKAAAKAAGTTVLTGSTSSTSAS